MFGAGSESACNELARLARELGIIDSVQMNGFIGKPRAEITKSNVLVAPS